MRGGLADPLMLAQRADSKGWEGENKRAVKQVGPLLLIIFD